MKVKLVSEGTLTSCFDVGSSYVVANSMQSTNGGLWVEVLNKYEFYSVIKISREGDDAWGKWEIEL